MQHPEQSASINQCGRYVVWTLFGLVFCCLVALPTRAASPASSLILTEAYRTTIRNDPDFGPEAVPIVTSSITASFYTNVPVTSLTKKARWSITVGAFGNEYSGAFSNNVNFGAGDRNITLPLINPDTSQSAGNVFISWNESQLNVRVTTSVDLLGALSFYTGATQPIVDTADITIAVGKFTNTATLYLSGRNAYRLDPATQLDLDSGNVFGRADFIPPNVVIQSPPSNYATLNEVVNVAGLATDNIGVAAVLWRIAAPGDNPTLPASRFSDWSYVDTLNLPDSGAPTTRAAWRTAVDMSYNGPGTNRLWVVSQDQIGRYSPIQTRNFFYSVPSPLTLESTDGGRVQGASGVFNNANLIIDRSYLVKAVATDTNNIFLNWTDGSGNVVSINPQYKFLMQDSLSLQANFGPNPFPDVQGTYISLFSPTNGYNEIDSGMITIKVTPRGTYTGTIALESGAYTFSGQFGFYSARSDPNAADSSFQIKVTGIQPILGTLHLAGSADGGLTRQLTGQLSLYDFRLARRVITPFVTYYCPTNTGSVTPGTYNFQLPTANGTTQVGPLGYGYGTILLRSNATALVSVTLADLTPVLLCNSSLTENGNLPLFVAPYGGKGIAIGWLTFTNEATSDLRGDNVHWFKRRNASTYYKDGFHRSFQITGCRYIAPKPGTNILGWTSGTASFADFAFSGATSVNFDPAFNRFSFPNGNADSLRLSLSPTIGVFTGGVSRPSLPLRGIVLPKANKAVGFFLDHNQSGFVVVSSP
jgi:hypothetical protein